MPSVLAYAFPNDGRLDLDTSCKILLEHGAPFQDQAAICYQAVYGSNPAQHVRLFDDYGAELTDLNTAVHGSGELLLIVSFCREDFKVIDYKSKLLRELAREGWVHDEDGEDELVKLVEGLSDAVYLDSVEMGRGHPHLELESIALPANSEAQPPDSSPLRICTEEGLLGEATEFGLATQQPKIRDLSVDEVLAQMPHISIADSSAPALGDDADAAQLLMDHIKLPVVDIERIERLAASPEQRSEASMHSEESVPGPRRAVKEVDADQEEAPLDEALAGQQMADSKYRKKMQGAVSELQSLLPDLADADRVGRATVFRNATVYIRTITGANADMRQENDQLRDKLRKERQRLSFQYGVVREQMIGVVMQQCYFTSKEVEAKRLVPLNPKRPFYGFLIYWNHVMELITGYSAKEVLGQPSAVAYGFYRNEYTRRAHVDYIRNAPDWTLGLGNPSPPRFLILERKSGEMLSFEITTTLFRNNSVFLSMSIITNFKAFQPRRPS